VFDFITVIGSVTDVLVSEFDVRYFTYVFHDVSVTVSLYPLSKIIGGSLPPISLSVVFLIPRLHDTDGCQTGYTTGLTTGCIV